MGMKTIMVCLTTPENTETLLKVAVPMARKHNAHLVGFHTLDALLAYPGIAMHIPEFTFVAFNDSQQKDSEAIKEVFVKHTRNEDFVSNSAWSALTQCQPTSEWWKARAPLIL